MTNSLNTRISRTSALAMLLVWVFGLISGVANACLLDDPGAATHVIAAAQPAQHAGSHLGLVRHLQNEASSTQTEDAHTSKQPCLKVCDDNSRSLPKKYQAGQIDLGLPSVVAVLWSLVDSVYLSHTQPGSTQRVVSKVPLRHRYARLTL